eukprot:543074-Lingulodinium_polyedra.AAC.1
MLAECRQSLGRMPTDCRQKPWQTTGKMLAETKQEPGFGAPIDRQKPGTMLTSTLACIPPESS